MHPAKKFILAALASAVSVATPALAQHQGHHGGATQAQAQAPAQTQPDTDRMMRMMREMMPMMERMRSASPQERAQMMERMGPMMREMMPMMQGMMGMGGMGGMQGMPGMQGQGAGAARTDAAASTRAFQEANDRMHRDMAIDFTGNADVDFVRGMIPHHQGAIDMARVVLQHGRDETTRKWANEIIREQEREITEMREWLRRNVR